MQMKSVSIRADIAEEMPTRIAAVEAAVLCIADALEGEAGIADYANTALRGLALELGRIYCDLDVAAWNSPQPRKRKSSALPAATGTQ